MTTNLTPVARNEFSAQLIGEDWLDSLIYTDPSVYAVELERIFYRSWICLGHEAELPKVGDYKTVTLGAQPLLVIRRSDTEIGAFFNRCRHRGTLLCDLPKGHVEKVVCPYHGWVYDLGGRLIGTPYPGGYDRKTFKPRDYGLVPVPRMSTYRGFLFASLAAEGETLTDHLGLAKPYLDTFVGAAGIEVNTGRNIYEYEGNWKLQSENVVDDYHLPFIHESYFDVLRERNGGEVTPASSNPNLRSWDLGNGHGMLDFREYAEDGTLASPNGERKNVAGSLPFNLLVFPTLALAADHFRITTPLGAAKTRVELVHVVPTGASAREREIRIRRHEDFYGPAGFAMPDDLEVAFRRVSQGLKCDRGSRKIHMGRGIGRESLDADGSRWSHITDETPQRGFYRRWRTLVDRD